MFKEKMTDQQKKNDKMEKLWLAVTNEKEAFTFKWMVEVDLNKWFKFVKLANGSIGFTQVKEKKDTKL